MVCAEEHDGDGDGEFGPLVKRASLPTTRSHCRRAGLRVRWRRNIFRHRIGYFNRGHVRLGKVTVSPFMSNCLLSVRVHDVHGCPSYVDTVLKHPGSIS